MSGEERATAVLAPLESGKLSLSLILPPFYCAPCKLHTMARKKIGVEKREANETIFAMTLQTLQTK